MKCATPTDQTAIQLNAGSVLVPLQFQELFSAVSQGIRCVQARQGHRQTKPIGLPHEGLFLRDLGALRGRQLGSAPSAIVQELEASWEVIREMKTKSESIYLFFCGGESSSELE